MLFLRRPPYARWAGIGLLIVFALWADLRDGVTQRYPFAAVDLAAGTALSEDVITWREAPDGLIPLPDLDGKVTARPLRRGDPLVPSALAEHRPPPDDWWSLELTLPQGASPGSKARVVVDDPPLATSALVVSVFDGGTFDSSLRGLVAVPAAHADALARAAYTGRAVVMLAMNDR